MSTHLETVDTLRRLATHLVARARVEATGRFSLRVTPGGFGTPEFGDGPQRVRISGGTLLIERDPMGDAGLRAVAIDGSTLAALATAVGVDLDDPIDVGHDTPPLGDAQAPIELDQAAAAAVHRALALGAAALDLVAAALPAEAAPTLARLWPEHFDVALDAAARPARRVNLGVSPGDGYSEVPYAYAGPWTADRPGDDGFWNAPFGAARPLSELGDDPATIAAFMLDAFTRLGGTPTTGH